MTEKITHPMTPDVLNPAPLGPLSGDYKDDDSAVYEADFTAADHRPEKATGVPHPVKEIKSTNRLLIRTVQVGTINAAIQDPLMLLPADPNRKSLSIHSWANSKTFVIGTDKGDCYSGATLMAVAQAPVLVLTGYTGALWAYSTETTNVMVTAVAVTE